MDVVDGQCHASCQLQYTYNPFSRKCVSLKGMRGHLSRLDIYISSIFIKSKSITPTRVFNIYRMYANIAYLFLS